jgi:DNA-binding NtrC family response regulator
MSGLVHDSVLVGDSPPIRRLRELVATIAPTRLSVLVEGATGTGKELVAALLHKQSGRSGNLVAFNVCALGESMFEDSLFGHVRGAYTGAVGESLGFLREANGGTAFFDEISGLQMPMQAKLLRAVETGVFRPIGAARDVFSDFRTVAATNERLTDLVERGRFRADLKHRLSGVVITVPTLAERVEDIPELARYFVRRATGVALPIESCAMDLLMDTPWPGNIRELKQVIDVAAAFAREIVDVHVVETVLAHRATGLATDSVSDDRVERRALVSALQDVAWDVDRAAERLGIHRATIYRRMKRHGVEVPRVAPGRATTRPGRATNATMVMSQ